MAETTPMMKPNFLKDLDGSLEDSAQIRHELNTVHWKTFGKIQELMVETIEGMDLKAAKSLNDLYYYKDGGYPNETTPPRHHSAAKKLGDMFQFAEAMGDGDMINDYLEEHYGLKLTRTRDFELKMKENINTGKVKKLEEATNVEILSRIPNTTPAKLLAWMITSLTDQQGVICREADRIKIDNYEKISAVHKEEGFTKGIYVKGVNTKAAGIRSMERAQKTKKTLTGEATMMRTVLDVAIKH